MEWMMIQNYLSEVTEDHRKVALEIKQLCLLPWHHKYIAPGPQFISVEELRFNGLE